MCLVDVTLECVFEGKGVHICAEAKIDHRHHCRLSLIVPPELSLFLLSLRSGSLFVSSHFFFPYWMSDSPFLKIPSQASTTFTINILGPNSLSSIFVISERNPFKSHLLKVRGKDLALSLKLWLCGLAPPTCISSLWQPEPKHFPPWVVI